MSGKIHPSAVIAADVEIGSDVVVGPHCVLDEGVAIGDNTILDANVMIGKNVRIGKYNQLFSCCVIGRAPQLLGLDPNTPVGGLNIGDNNVIREHVTIHPSMYPEEVTKIGNENLLMVGVHLGHDCVLEDKIVISNYSQISGHCKIETGVWLSGMVAVHQFVTFGKWCYAAGFSGVNHDVPPFVIISGHYPPEVRSINKRGLQRAGLAADEQNEIFKAFKQIYRGEGPLLDRVNDLIAKDGLDPNVRHMADAIIKSSQHRFGRYLEQYRENH